MPAMRLETPTQDTTFEALQERLKVRFKDIDLLHQALRHRSVCMDSPGESNERLEFLGDSIVGLVICEYLCALFPDRSEGELAKAKAYLASEPILAEAGHALGLDEAVMLSDSESASGGRRRRSIVSDAFEALIAAIYLDRGLPAARRIVRSALKPALAMVAADEYTRDFKSLLQEKTQADFRKTPHYVILNETGADHDKTFVARAQLGKKVIGEGTGKSKKEAEQAAALAALETLAAMKGKTGGK
jgi:ribonuclease-3